MISLIILCCSSSWNKIWQILLTRLSRSGFDSTKLFNAIGFKFLLSFKYLIRLSLFGVTLGQSKMLSNFSSSVWDWYGVRNCVSVTLASLAFIFDSFIMWCFIFVTVCSGIISLNEYILFIEFCSSSVFKLLFVKVGRKVPLVVIILFEGFESFSYFSTKFFGKEIFVIFRLICFACLSSPLVNVVFSVSMYSVDASGFELLRDFVL